jgi:FkbM family methyltransferase
MIDDASAQVNDAFRSLLGLRSLAQELDKLPPGNPRFDDEDFLAFCYRNCHRSSAQLFQDLFVAYQLREKRSGYFVEFGAADGVELSNTLLLERDYGWQGIVGEPARTWHERLQRNRRCVIDTRCVWSRSGERLTFNETPMPELSTIDAFTEGDGHAPLRAGGVRYEVSTVSLNALLAEHRAPQHIDYLSIDTEGSELEILRAFDFGRHRMSVITVEHNFAPARDEIRALLSARGYERKFVSLSQWDDWYVRA